MHAAFDSLYLSSEWLILLGMFALVEGATLFGLWLGRRHQGETTHLESQLGAVLGGILGLLALLLAFTFGMAADRFDARKRLVVEEANALGTLHLRADLVSEPGRTRLRSLIAQYVAADVDFYNAGVTPERLEEVEQRISRLHRALWDEGVKAVSPEPRSVLNGLLIQSLNDVIDHHEMRRAAVENRVPSPVLALLAALAAVGCGLLGFAGGLGPRRDWPPVLIAGLVVVLVVMMIVDLRPATARPDHLRRAQRLAAPCCARGWRGAVTSVGTSAW